MKNETITRELYEALVRQLENSPLVLAQTLSRFERNRRKLAHARRKHFICLLDRHILEQTRSVVLVIEYTGDYYMLKLCCPLTKDEYDRLAALNYVPILREKHYLTVGLESSYPHAYSAIRLSIRSSVMDLFDSLFVLCRELENLLLC